MNFSYWMDLAPYFEIWHSFSSPLEDFFIADTSLRRHLYKKSLFRLLTFMNSAQNWEESMKITQKFTERSRTLLKLGAQDKVEKKTKTHRLSVGIFKRRSKWSKLELHRRNLNFAILSFGQ